ncbi:MAG: dihydroneopterin aldolase [Prevotella sp.]|nr:dihydroneopterin aldolase [Prevotella sp.]
MTLQSSSISIRAMRFYARHGVLEQERRVGGWFVVSLRVHYNITRAMQTDELDATISYADLYDLVKREMAVPSQLLEHVAGRIGEAVLSRYPQATALDLSIEKENPPMGADCAGAGVQVHLINDKTTG